VRYSTSTYRVLHSSGFSFRLDVFRSSTTRTHAVRMLHKTVNLPMNMLNNESGDKRRDRDVQAARNILWLLQYMYYGVDRAEYMCRGA
jgi:hypothetical protein